MRIALACAALLLTLAAPAAAAPQLVKLGDFNRPVDVTSPPGDARLFVVEKRGTIQIVGGGTFLNIASLVEGNDEERGLLSMAFSPGYAANGLFYVFYTDTEGDIRVVEYHASGNAADPNSARPIFFAEHTAEQFHNGGQLQFGPDGMLYVSIGDRKDGANAQDLSDNPFGKILRLDPATGAWTVWSYGLRNPWRFSFDRGTGDMAIGDVGEDSWEEVDWATAPDVNFGWPDSEGFAPTGQSPVIAHDHSGDDAFIAIVGGYVVRDPGLPTLNGRYLYGDYVNPHLYSAVPRTGADDRPEALTVHQLSSFGEDACGHIYATSLDGPVYRIQDGAVAPCSFNTDTTPPGLSVAVKGLRNAASKRRLLVAVRCTEGCQATIGTRLRKVRRLKTRHRSLAADRRAVIRLRLSKATAKRLRHRLAHHRSVKVSVAVRAIDAAGNPTVVRRGGRIKRRP